MTFRNVLVLAFVLAGAAMAFAQDLPQPHSTDWYVETYPFIQQRGKIFTAETEFNWPEGYHQLDSSMLTDFQYWVTNIPLWHSERPAARVKGVMYETEEICRTVHLPWRTIHFYDYFIPVQIMADYYFSRGDTNSFVWAPTAGDSIRYDRFLTHKYVLYRGIELQFEEAEPRSSSEAEVNRMMEVVARFTTYGSLANNCDTIAAADLRPGDLYISKNENGREGLVWVVLKVLEDDTGSRLFLVGTGCQEAACDFHIPRFNTDRSDPWIDMETLLTLGGDYTDRGFYRLPLKQN